MNFQEIGSAHAPEIKILKLSFPEIRLFRENFWMSFPGFANQG